MKCPNLSPWLLLLGFTAPLFGQTLPPLVASAGIAPGERRGSAVADAGDLDADGIADFWVGSPFDSTIGFQAGAVRAISGAHGGVLATCFGSAAVDHFGWAIAAFPDVNGDGVRDLAIGAPDSDVQAQNGGAVRVLSGANGGLLFTVAGSSSSSAFGFSVAAAGDVNGDGTQDFSVGAPFDAFGGTDAGAVFTYSGVNGAVLAHHPGSSGDRLGIAVAGAGDVDGDNRADILGGADQDASGTGRVHLWSGRTGALLRTLVGTDAGGHFGGALAGGFDATGDGVPDIAVGANAALRHGQPSGAAWIFSGTSGAPCFEAFGEGAHESFGSALALVPDLDGDGRADLVVAAAVENGAAGGHGVVRAFGGSSRRLLRTWRGTSGGDRFGWALCGGSDRDGDGLPELIVGAPKDDSPLVDSGTAFVLSTRAAAPVPYCTAKPNSQGCLPQIQGFGHASAGGSSTLELSVARVLNNKPGLFLFGTARAAAPFAGGTLCVAPPIRRSPGVASGGNVGASDCSGVLRFGVDASWIQLLQGQPGERRFVQAWSRDPQHPDGTASGLSSALEFTVWL